MDFSEHIGSTLIIVIAIVPLIAMANNLAPSFPKKVRPIVYFPGVSILFLSIWMLINPGPQAPIGFIMYLILAYFIMSFLYIFKKK